MNGSSLSASDVLALVGNRDDGFGFGGVGGFILLFIFLMAIGGNGFGWGGGNAATALGQSDIQNSLYFQSQDAAIRSLAQGQCNIIDSALNNKYDNAVLIKDLSNQVSTGMASIGQLINQQTSAIQNMFAENTIRELSDKVTVLRGENSNLVQTAQITNNILGNLATTAPKMPCAYPCCGCNSSLY
jgi:hypothetical protein